MAEYCAKLAGVSGNVAPPKGAIYINHKRKSLLAEVRTAILGGLVPFGRSHASDVGSEDGVYLFERILLCCDEIKPNSAWPEAVRQA